LGTPTEAYKEEGAKVWHYEQSTYGGTEVITGDINFIPFRYQGQYEDAETGLYYNRFRYYSPEEESYISQDPIGLMGGMALYGYVKDCNSWVDVFGLSSAYDVDTYGNLNGKDVPFDRLGNHHVPQKALAKTQVGGYPIDASARDAPAIRLPDAEHATITKLQAQNKVARSKMTASQLLQDDIDMLRKHTNAPETSIEKLKEMNKEKYNITAH